MAAPGASFGARVAPTSILYNRESAVKDAPPVESGDTAMRELLNRFVSAWESNDIDGVVALLRQDAVLSMPPFSSWYQGRDSVRGILSLHPFGWGKRAGWRLVPTRANGQPAFVLYRADHPGEPCNAFGLMVLGAGGTPAQVSSLTVFRKTALVTRFGFPLVQKFARESGAPGRPEPASPDLDPVSR